MLCNYYIVKSEFEPSPQYTRILGTQRRLWNRFLKKSIELEGQHCHGEESLSRKKRTARVTPFAHKNVNEDPGEDGFLHMILAKGQEVMRVVFLREVRI